MMKKYNLKETKTQFEPVNIVLQIIECSKTNKKKFHRLYSQSEGLAELNVAQLRQCRF